MTKSISDIVSEVVDSLNSDLPKCKKKGDAELMFKQIIDKAFSYDKTSIATQKRLRNALALKIAQDKLQFSNEPFAQFLVRQNWTKIAQSELNQAQEILDPVFRETDSMEDKVSDFYLNTWRKAGFSFGRLRQLKFALMIGERLLIFVLLIMNFFSLMCAWAVNSLFPKLFQFIAQKKLNDVIEEWKVTFPTQYDSVKKERLKQLRDDAYQNSCLSAEFQCTNQTPEEMKAHKSLSFDFFYTTCADDEEFIKWYVTPGREEEGVTYCIEDEFTAGLLNTGIIRAQLTAKALFASITSPLIGSYSDNAKSILYRSFLLATALILVPSLIAVKILDIVIFQPCDKIHTAICKITESLILLLITAPVFAKQYLTSQWRKHADRPCAEPEQGISSTQGSAQLLIKQKCSKPLSTERPDSTVAMSSETPPASLDNRRLFHSDKPCVEPEQKRSSTINIAHAHIERKPPIQQGGSKSLFTQRQNSTAAMPSEANSASLGNRHVPHSKL